MVADKSGSMEYEMPTLKRAMKNFLDDIEGSFGDYARVSVITFSGLSVVHGVGIMKIM